MATQVQWRGGSTAEHATFTGAAREITVDTQKQTLVVHDGSTAGGHPLQKQYPALGSAAAPTYTFTGDANTGIYSPGADQLALSVNGSEGVRLTTTGLGIGATSPTDKLHLHEASSNANYLHITNDTTGSTAGDGVIVGLDSSEQFYIYSYENNNLIFGNNNTERARIDSSGRLLVGTSNSANIRLNQKLAIVHAGDATYTGASFTGYCGSADQIAAPFLELQRSRGTADNTYNVLAAGDRLGSINFRGTDGTKFVNGANIAAEVDGTPGADDMPGRLVFSVTADGSASPTEAMRIKNSRILNFANTPVYADNAAAKTGGLVDGDVYRKSDGTLMIVYT